MARLGDRPELHARDRLAQRVQTDIGNAFRQTVRRLRRLSDQALLHGEIDEAFEPLEDAIAEAALRGGSLVDEEVNEVGSKR